MDQQGLGEARRADKLQYLDTADRYASAAATEYEVAAKRLRANCRAEHDRHVVNAKTLVGSARAPGFTYF